MIPKFKFSCYDCEEHTDTCHATCEIYKEELVEYQDRKKKIADARKRKLRESHEYERTLHKSLKER